MEAGIRIANDSERHDDSARRSVASHPTLTIDLDAVTDNVRAIRRRTTGEVMAVVKSDGFGRAVAAGIELAVPGPAHLRAIAGRARGGTSRYG